MMRWRPLVTFIQLLVYMLRDRAWRQVVPLSG
jgi:hypothetical protein